MSEPRYVRTPIVRVFHRRDATTLVGGDGVARRFEEVSAVLVREMLGFFIAPRTRTEFLAHMAHRADIPKTDELLKLEDDLLALLTEIRILIEFTEAPPSRTLSAEVRLVLGVTGAVAAIEVPTLVRLLLERGYDLRIVMTRAARRFVRIEALEALTHRKVYRGLWDHDADCPIPHINLAQWASAVLIYPATATTVSRIARGDCSDLVATVALATAGPVLLVPSMNARMYTSLPVRRNLEQLRADGFILVEPALGIELADQPDHRTMVAGPAPPPRAMVDVLELVLSERGSTPFK
jgi:3-polyprenyl-4-hydroxybenzoate decarboxylase